MNVSVNSCLPFYVDPAMAWQSIQRAPHLSPYRSSSDAKNYLRNDGWNGFS